MCVLATLHPSPLEPRMAECMSLCRVGMPQEGAPAVTPVAWRQGVCIGQAQFWADVQAWQAAFALRWLGEHKPNPAGLACSF